MDEITKTLQEKYINDITSKFPIYKIFIFLLFILSTYSYSLNTNDNRLLVGISKIKINYIFDFDSGLFSEISVMDFFACIAFVFINNYIYLKIKGYLFKIFTKKLDFNSIVKEKYERINIIKSEDNSLNFFISKDISVELSGHREKIKSFHMISEILLSFAICLLWGIHDFIIIEYIVLLILIMLIMCANFISFKYYLSKFIPYYVTERALLGAVANFGDD
ncbi:hypothetical protein [uncultured Desulfobulbus sp.]|uniref:hypothetical protein n=1 Tax=uncultured Desulfobulbus sp. TaxID=239745 RepID=UPI0029C703D1|nr:hypothetical protein [uncultured Desulfobulbus sp.]